MNRHCFRCGVGIRNKPYPVRGTPGRVSCLRCHQKGWRVRYAEHTRRMVAARERKGRTV